MYLGALLDANAEILGRTDYHVTQLAALKQERGGVEAPPMSVPSRPTTPDALYLAPAATLHPPESVVQVQTTVLDPEPTEISWPVRCTPTPCNSQY